MVRVRKIVIFILVFLLCNVGVYASESGGNSYKIDNNGNPRENPYGKNSSIPASFVGVDYYDCYIPYAKTVEEIGGICTKIGANNPDGYYAMPDYVKSWRVGDRTNYQGNYSSVNGVSRSGYDDTGCAIYTDSNGTQYYAMAVQKFFYNKDGAYYGWSTANRGQIIDVIFTDGSVAHFIVGDANAEQHTNGWSGGYVNEADFICNTLNYTQYKALFSCMSGNCFELWGKSSDCANWFLKKFGLKSDGSGNHVAYYRMYNAKISDPPKRSSGVPSDVSYKLGNVTIDDTTPDSDNNASGSSGEGNSTNPLEGGVVNNWVPEDELQGMPDFIDLSKDSSGVVLPDRSGLSKKEVDNIELLKEDVKDSLLDRVVYISRILIFLMGVLLYVYDVFFIVAYIFDRSNNFLDISLLSVMSGGKINKSIFEEEGSGLIRVVKIVIVCFIVGTLLLSGVAYGLVGRVIVWVGSVL